MTNGFDGLRGAFASLSSSYRIFRAGLRDPRIGVTGAIVGAVALAIATAPVPVPDDGLWYNADGRLMAEHQVASGAVVKKPTGITVVPGSARKLYKDFRAIGYRLEDVMAGTELVPRVFVKAMPRDLRQLNSIDTRKQVFIKTMLPLILRVNEELRQNRARIAELNQRVAEGGVLSAAESRWIAAQYERHDVKPGDIALLLRRVDVIPPSLALAQAAEESGWGTSRFAQEGRALFGQRTHANGIGLVPAAHAAEAGIKVKSFDELLDGVRSYARNLNTHNAYADFRQLRARMREQARDMSGLNSMRLIETLRSYSERGMDYVDTIKTIIRVNNLRRLDGARLSANIPAEMTRLGA
jgi:Bax protein